MGHLFPSITATLGQPLPASEKRPARASGGAAEDGAVITEEVTDVETRLKRPRPYHVILHNDDYTTREFVVEVLCHIFHRSEAESVNIMLEVHTKGQGIAGTYAFEVAETKVKEVEALAHAQEFPLKLSLEPAPED